MKLKLLALALMFTIVPAFALTVSETTSTDYMRANGYSYATIDAVQASKAAVNGEQYVSFDEQKYGNCNAFVKWVRKFFTYFDPALVAEPVLKHDTKLTPSINDI